MDRRGFDQFDLAYRMQPPAAPVGPPSAPLGLGFIALAVTIGFARGAWFLSRSNSFSVLNHSLGSYRALSALGILGALIGGAIAAAIGARRALLLAIVGLLGATVLSFVPDETVGSIALYLGAFASGVIPSAGYAALGERLGRASIGERVVGFALVSGIVTVGASLAALIPPFASETIGDFGHPLVILVACIALLIAGGAGFFAQSRDTNNEPVDRKVAPLVLLALLGRVAIAFFDAVPFRDESAYLGHSGWTYMLATDLGAVALVVLAGTLFSMRAPTNRIETRTGVLRIAVIGFVIAAFGAFLSLISMQIGSLFTGLGGEMVTISLLCAAAFGHGRTMGTLVLAGCLVATQIAATIAPFFHFLTYRITYSLCGLGFIGLAILYFIVGPKTEERAGFDLTS